MLKKESPKKPHVKVVASVAQERSHILLDTAKAVESLWNGKTAIASNQAKIRKLGFVAGGKKKNGPPKAIITVAPRSQGMVWIYYPKPDEALRFSAGRKHLVPGGPADKYVGSVGVIDVHFHGSNKWEITEMQGCYDFRKTPQISQWLSSKHGGWKQHLLNSVFEKAKSRAVKEVSMVLPFEDPKEWYVRQVELFQSTATKHGYKKINDWKVELV